MIVWSDLLAYGFVLSGLIDEMAYAAIVVSLVELALLIGATHLAMLVLWHVSRESWSSAVATGVLSTVLVFGLVNPQVFWLYEFPVQLPSSRDFRMEAACARVADGLPNESEFDFSQYCALGGL